MANSNGSFGLRPLSKLGSGSNSTGVSAYSMYEIANGNTNKIYHGSPIIPLSTGYVDIVGAADGGTVAMLGAFQGCEYVDSTTGKTVWKNYWPGSGADSNHPVKAFVADDPNQLFVIATDATWTSKAVARAAVFNNADFSTATTGTDATGVSLCRLAISTIAATAGLSVRIMGWVDDPENADFSAAGIGAIVRFTTNFNSPEGGIVVGTPAMTGV